MKNITYKIFTVLILIIVVIMLLDSTSLMGIGATNIGWDLIHEGTFGQYVTADFTARDNGILFMFAFLLLIAFIYILSRIYKAISKRKRASKLTRKINNN